MIVFIVITILAHREKLQKKRSGELRVTADTSDSSVASISREDEKKLTLKDEDILAARN